VTTKFEVALCLAIIGFLGYYWGNGIA